MFVWTIVVKIVLWNSAQMDNVLTPYIFNYTTYLSAILFTVSLKKKYKKRPITNLRSLWYLFSICYKHTITTIFDINL